MLTYIQTSYRVYVPSFIFNHVPRVHIIWHYTPKFIVISCITCITKMTFIDQRNKTVLVFFFRSPTLLTYIPYHLSALFFKLLFFYIFPVFSIAWYITPCIYLIRITEYILFLLKTYMIHLNKQNLASQYKANKNVL